MQIEKIKDGGYLVSPTRRNCGDQNYYEPFLFASTTIDEALKYIKLTFEPKPTK